MENGSLTYSHSVGHHSTSDDSFAYRARQEVEDRKRIDNPISRFRLFLQTRGWWSDDDEEELKARLKKDVMQAFKRAEGLKRHELKEMFTDVYGGEEPWNIVSSYLFVPRVRVDRSPLQKEQRQELAGLLKKYGQTWEPWRLELRKFKGNGEELTRDHGKIE